jgi:hypothetical protein
MLFILLLALSLLQFLMIAESNLLLDEIDNSIFIFGLRFFIVLSPLVVLFLKNSTACIVFGGIIIGQLLLIFFDPKTIGVVLLSFSLSISTFLIRMKASENILDASLNKVALHLGSIASGFFIYILLDKKSFFWAFSIFIGLICFLLSFMFFYKNKTASTKTENFKKNRNIALSFQSIFWSFSGISLGIRSYAPYIILPQFLIYKIGYLPEWYGLQISVYSVLVILFQIPTARYRVSFSLNTVFLSLLFIGIVSSLPAIFHAESFLWSFIWLFIVASQELFSGTIDNAAHKDSSLIFKELFVGLGGGISTLIMRYTGDPFWIGVLSCITVTYCLISLFYRKPLSS